MLKRKSSKIQRVDSSSGTANITGCIRCGTCCLKGGPTLHKEDRKLVLEGFIGYQHLMTIRKGELAYSPISERLEPVKKELVKIAGKGKGWACLFYDKEQSCTIYEYRPLECRLLECSDNSRILPVIGKDTLARNDLINPNNPVAKLIKIHEKECPVQKVEALIGCLKKKTDRSLDKLTEFVRKDIAIRRDAVSKFGLSLSVELFIFGRPLFKLLGAYGISVREGNNDISLSIDSSDGPF